MRSQGGSHIHAGHRIRLTIGPADVRLLFDARLDGQCACDFQFTDFVPLILRECDSGIMVGFNVGLISLIPRLRAFAPWLYRNATGFTLKSNTATALLFVRSNVFITSSCLTSFPLLPVCAVWQRNTFCRSSTTTFAPRSTQGELSYRAVRVPAISSPNWVKTLS